MTIQNLTQKNDIIEFDINNKKSEYKISFCNALRRILISNIKCYCINFNEIKMHENNSIFNNEFLKKRLSLIPIISNHKQYNYEHLVIYCEKKNDEEIHESVYVRDFKIKDTMINKEYDIKDFCKYPDLLFTKLQNNQYIHFEAHLTNSNAFEGGSSFSPISSCAVTFKNSNIKNEKDIEKRERDYDVNKDNSPSIYQFKYENIGFYEGKEVLQLALQEIQDRLELMKLKFKNIEYQNDFYIFNIEDENDTLGNLVTSYLLDHKDINYSSYQIVHPLKNNIVVKLKTDQKKEKLFDIIEKTIDNLKKMYIKLNIKK